MPAPVEMTSIGNCIVPLVAPGFIPRPSPWKPSILPPAEKIKVTEPSGPVTLAICGVQPLDASSLPTTSLEHLPSMTATPGPGKFCAPALVATVMTVKAMARPANRMLRAPLKPRHVCRSKCGSQPAEPRYDRGQGAGLLRHKRSDQLQKRILPIAAAGQKVIEGHLLLGAAIDDIIGLADDEDLAAVGVTGEMEQILITVGLVIFIELLLYNRHLVLPYDQCLSITVV
ncbi:hypothetical protein Arad_3859 [Rhizobium rhizogenes K84]|uniref:Uncharacterized protein n=1 Tax=Rhizobium rhizogenes (strain K84 / ATCC BAA-868) TaxID=311403 RepID=B9JA93_RHIR8|nr:hypothetical protein Arad_3859 [Rhizobium rhizogenes K84]